MSTSVPPAPAAVGARVDRAHPRVHSTWAATIRTALIATMAVTIVLLAFLWPSYGSKVRDLPITVTGPSQIVNPLQKQLQAGETFEVSSASDRAEAVRRIRERETYGGIVATSKRIEVLTASAASPVASQTLTGVGRQIQAQTQAQALAAAQKGGGAQAQAPRVVFTDVVPLSDKDPRGTLLSVGALPLAMGGMIGGALISMLVVGYRRRIVAVLTYGIVAGFVLSLIMGTWFGALNGTFALEWLILGLGLVATASVIIGLNSLIGAPGIAVGAILTLFIGNPLSSSSSPTEFLPWHWGAVGQWFVPGASSTLLRLESYFPDAPKTQYWWALVLWALAGLALSTGGRFRDQQVLKAAGGVEPDDVRPARPRHEGDVNGVDGAGLNSSAAPQAATAPSTTRPGATASAPRQQGSSVGQGPSVAHGSPAIAPTAALPSVSPATTHALPAAGAQATLRGVVRRGASSPLAGVSITVTDEGGTEIGHTVTDASGAYRVHLPGTGSYLVIAAAPGLSPAAGRVTATSGDAVHDIRVGGRASLSGRVMTGSRSTGFLGVSGAAVTLTDSTGEVVEATRTGADGAYTFSGLTAGDYVVTARSDAHLPGAVGVSVADAAAEICELHLGDVN